MNIAERLGRIGLWAGPLAWLPSSAQRELLPEIERAGFGTLWYGESIGREAFAFAAILLAASERINVGSGIANIYARDPMAMANGARALEEAWPGRFVLGIGVSHTGLVEGRGHRYERPVQTMSAYLEGMEQAAWRGPEVEMPPVVLAALGPKMLELAAARTAGAHPYFVPVEHTRRARRTLGGDALLAPEQAVIFAHSRDEARPTGEKHLHVYLNLPNYRNNLVRLGWTEEALQEPASDELFDALIAWGDEDAIAGRAREHLDAGADHVALQPLTTEPQKPYREEIERLATVIRELN